MTKRDAPPKGQTFLNYLAQQVSSEDLLRELAESLGLGDTGMLVSIKVTVNASIKEDDVNGMAAVEAILKETGEGLYAQIALVSNHPPTISVEIDDEEHGTRDIGLFHMSSHEEDYSGE